MDLLKAIVHYDPCPYVAKERGLLVTGFLPPFAQLLCSLAGYCTSFGISFLSKNDCLFGPFSFQVLLSGQDMRSCPISSGLLSVAPFYRPSRDRGPESVLLGPTVPKSVFFSSL